MDTLPKRIELWQVIPVLPKAGTVAYLDIAVVDQRKFLDPKSIFVASTQMPKNSIISAIVVSFFVSF